MIGEELAGYRLLAVLGRGGMSVVYVAENSRLSNTVALKVLSPDLATDDVFRARFLHESRVAASLNHPNVIPIYDMGAVNDLLYIAMRHVAGADLRAMLKVNGSLPPEKAVPIVAQAGRALDAAHRRQLVHRDVKPANLLIERGEEGEPDHVYLADFGISKHELSLSGLSATGHFVGTLAYMAPEQIQGRHVDGRADIYSLGCVLYEALTGKVPFPKDVDAAVIWAHVEELPPPPSEIAGLPTAMDEVIARALAKDPDRRYSTCREFMAAVSDALNPAAPADATRIAMRAVPGSLPEPTTGADQVVTPEVITRGEPTAARDIARGADPAVAIDEAATAAPGGSNAPSTPPADGTITDDGPTTSERSRFPRQRVRWWVALAATLAAGIAIGAVALSNSSGPAPPSLQRIGARVGPVPTNRVTGAGKVTLKLRGNVVTIAVVARGLLPGSPHLMHIHAGGLGSCPAASAAGRFDGHPFISTGDGIKYYGQTVASLTEWGSTSGVEPNNVAFNRYTAGGNITYTRQFTVPPVVADLIRDDNAVVVIHGIDYNDNHRYDFAALGVSDLDRSYPAEATAPALCGQLRPQATASGPTKAASAPVFTASLHVADIPFPVPAVAGTQAQARREFWLLCHLAGLAAPSVRPSVSVHLAEATGNATIS
jgi:serine/threonine protein kinase